MAELMTTKEAAERIGVSVGTVQNHINAGRLPATKVGRDFLLTPADVERFAEAYQTVRGT